MSPAWASEDSAPTGSRRERGTPEAQAEADLKAWPCSSGGVMVGRKSSMLLMAFCMTPSKTHSSGRHSSSISLVDAAGKYLDRQKAGWARGTCTPLTAAHRMCTHGLQLLIKAFRMCSSELPSRGGGVSTCTSGQDTCVCGGEQEPTWGTR